MSSSIKLYTLLAFISFFAFSCEKEISAPEDSINSSTLSVEQQTKIGQRYARVQNCMNDFFISAFAGVVAQPAFYGVNMTATETTCPTTTISDNGDVLTMQFGQDAIPEGLCTTLNYTEVGGTLALNKNFCSNMISTRECQPGTLEFDELYIQDCTVEAVRTNGDEELHAVFYAREACLNLNDTENVDEETVSFWFSASDKWEMKITDYTRGETTFNPINNHNGAFMHIQAPNIFTETLNFEELYDTHYQISLLGEESGLFNELVFKGAGEEGEDIKMLVKTKENLVYAPYQCQNIISGKVILMNLDKKPLICIDYNAGAEEADAGECDNIVKICPCDKDGNAITNSPDCMVTSCLPL